MTRFLEGITVNKPLMKSKYNNTCWLCNKPIRKGDWVIWSPGFKSVQHPDCKSDRVGYNKVGKA